MKALREIFTYVHPVICSAIEGFEDKDTITEIRLSRSKKPLVCTLHGTSVIKGEFEDPKLFDYSVSRLTGGNLYSVSDTLLDGYITLPGGHRAGVCASAVTKGRDVTNIKDISSVCFRVAREVKGVGKDIACEILKRGIHSSVLIASPPGFGKTTVLRDVCRILADGCADGVIRKVGIADERHEIASVCGGVAGFDIGVGAFVCDGYPKTEALFMMLRTMSPDVLVADEIGSGRDAEAIRTVSRCGVGLIVTAHAYSPIDLRTRFGEDLRCFDMIFFINNKKSGYIKYRRENDDY